METNCKGLSINTCSRTPNCIYVNGEKRKYCRSFKNKKTQPQLETQAQLEPQPRL